jgi:phosphatidylinositol alpha-1,6-mannosyltransferase
MKTLILATDMFARGGISRYTATLASALGQALGPGNLDVLVWVNKGFTGQAVSGFELFGPVSENTRAASKVRYVCACMRMARRRYDLLIANHVGLAQVAAAIRLLWGTPFWVACYGHEVWGRLPTSKLAALRGAQLILAISRFTAERLQTVNGIPAARIRLLLNAVPTRLASLLSRAGSEAGTATAGPRERVLLSVGDLGKGHAYKGFDTVIRALPRILARVPNARYTIVGEGDNRPNLQRLAASAGVSEHVTFAGGVSDDELAALYRSCDVFVMPSRALGADGPASGEGLGFVYLEASLAAKPVVGSREGGAAEAVLHGRTGVLVNPRSADEVARAVVTLLTDAELAMGMGAAGRKWALENFTQDAMATALRQLLHLTGHLVGA